ncbi:LysR family transcriptional regulator [Spongiibacter sp. KMU-166]|uniref:LysR family transcriptional regulator n=1 Tax=Spongiibacter thalassae TaxID=2721624 RepID=A0ABX1GBJ9_9GAMM|nr:LysR family transcriptional regulator [Spongiibacter thalassae]NKI16535.1 LysR family transcriptional regulator [Spongiibacter thalassae]
MKINLRKLEHAAVLAEEGNYKKAALRLCITQPALSRSIAKLEEEMEFAIFERAQTGVVITALGKRFLDRANGLLQHASDMDYDMSLAKKGMGGELAFGMGPYPEAALLERLIQKIMDEEKGVRIRAEVTGPENLLSQLKAEEIEFFLANAERLTLEKEFISYPIFDLKLSFYIRRGHPLEGKVICNARELLHYPIIGTVASAGQVKGLKLRLGLPLTSDFNFAVACNDIHLLKSLAKRNNAIMIAPQLALSAEDREVFIALNMTGNLSCLADARVKIDVIRFATRELSPAAELAIKLLEEMSDTLIS